MANYIDKAALVGERLTSSEQQLRFREMTGTEAYYEFLRLVNDTPAAEVDPVKHGCKFCSNEDNGAMCWDCSDMEISVEYRAGKIRITTEAGGEAYLTVTHCPCCGAWMDGDDEDAL